MRHEGCSCRPVCHSLLATGDAEAAVSLDAGLPLPGWAMSALWHIIVLHSSHHPLA